MATQKGTGLVERAVREALGTLVSPQICEQLIVRSLASHGLSGIPESGAQLGQWLEGGLRAELETAVGADAADLLVGQLQPIAAYAAIAVPRTTRDGTPSPANNQKRRPSTPARAAPASDPLSGARSLPLPAFDDEPDRPTDLRFDTSQEPNWEIEMPAQKPAAAGAFGNSAPARRNPFDSGPPTGMYQNKELSYSPTPEAPRSSPVRTLPPAHTISDRPTHESMSTTRPQDINAVGGASLPVVLTATADARDLEALRRYLANTASVVHIPDLVGLLDALEDGALVEPIVLIDCQRPTVHVTSVAAIGEDLPKGTTVVLWGADDPTWSQIDRARTPACRWVRCSREATTDDVGSLCNMLLG
jgi:hypothetical protein